MGKILKYAKKKRDKKYDPYKLLKKKNEELEKMSSDLLKDAVEYEEDGETIKLDEAGKPVFKDSIQWETDGPQIMAIWIVHKAVIEERLVPPNDLDAAFDSMTLYAREYRNTNKPYTITIPINYFVGTWHILNTSRKFHLFKHDKALSNAIDGLTMWFAKRIDMYHEVKRREKVQDEVSPEVVLKLPKKKSFEEFQKDAKVLEFKK